MNKQFIILTGVLTLILVGVLIATTMFRSTSATPTPTATSFTIPTTAPIPHSDPTINRPTTTPLTDDELGKLYDARQKMPLEKDGLLVDYSSLLDTFYIQSTATDEAAFNAFLDENGLRDLYNAQPSKFKKVTKNPSAAIHDDELRYQLTIDDDHEDVVNIQTDQQKQIETLGSLLNVMLDFSIPTPQPTSAAGQTTPNITPAQATPPPITYAGDTTQIPCGAGRDQGVANGYKDGQLFKIRICRVQGMNINSQISKAVDDMIVAARSAGIFLTGGSFRDMNGQIAIYQAWCKRDGIAGSPPPYPKAPGQTIRCPGGGAPGYSNHQMGLAIDFNCDGKLIPQSYASASQNKCFKWLQANAARYGLHELGMGKESSRTGKGYEGWHWSVNGN